METPIIDINESSIHNFVNSLRPEDLEIRKKLDFGYSYQKNTFILFEIRPVWNNPSEILHSEFAKIRFYRARQEWSLYWMRASGKWELYDPFPKSSYLDKIIQIIKEDDHHCFFG